MLPAAQSACARLCPRSTAHVAAITPAAVSCGNSQASKLIPEEPLRDELTGLAVTATQSCRCAQGNMSSDPWTLGWIERKRSWLQA